MIRRNIKNRVGVAKKACLFVLLCLPAGLHSQQMRVGFSVGVSFSFGTLVNRIGLHSGGFIALGPTQINATVKGFYNFQSLGLKRKTLELQLGLSGQLGWGRKDTLVNNFIGLTENNTDHDYAFGLSFMHYRDRLGTTQSTGLINLNIHNFNIITENDLFGNLIKQHDRYRTGAFLIEYQYANTKVGITALLWTPNYAHCPIIINENTKKWARFGYYQDADVANRDQTVGALSLQVRQWLPYNQEASLNIGANGEQIRNALQNKFIHNQPFFPASWVKRKPPHIPMITVDSKQYLYLQDQKVKPLSFYFNLGLNTALFY